MAVHAPRLPSSGGGRDGTRGRSRRRGATSGRAPLFVSVVAALLVSTLANIARERMTDSRHLSDSPPANGRLSAKDASPGRSCRVTEPPRQIAPYGAWPSPISSELLTAARVGLSEPRLDRANVYWCESRPWEKGRTVIVRRGPDGAIADVFPEGFDARTRVHEY